MGQVLRALRGEGNGTTVKELGGMPREVEDRFFPGNETLAEAILMYANMSLALGSALLEEADVPAAGDAGAVKEPYPEQKSPVNCKRALWRDEQKRLVRTKEPREEQRRETRPQRGPPTPHPPHFRDP